MIAPWALIVGLVLLGGLAGGLAGAVTGLLLALGILGAVVAAAATWAQLIGRMLDPADAWELAPRPPGFASLCDWVYARTLPPGETSPEAAAGAEEPPEGSEGS